MIEKGKISALQMAMVMNPTILATGILLVPAITVKHAKQDLWLSPIWASFIGFLVLYTSYQLHKLYPKKTIIEFSSDIIGRLPSKIISFFYILFFLHINGIVIREYAEFVTGTFLSQTPIYVVMGSMLLICSFAVYGGLEVIGRVSEIILPVVTLLYILIIIMLLKDLDVKQIFPVMEDGIAPSFLGSVVPQSWFSEFFLLSFMLPFLNDQKGAVKWGLVAICSVSFVLVSVNLVIYMLFGELTGTFTYPVMVAVRYISIADFLEHLEAIVMAIWVSGTFIKITIFYYVNVLCTAQWLKLTDFRPIVFPMGFILAIIAVWSSPNLQELSIFLSTSAPFYFLFFQVGVPLLLLCIALMRKKLQKKREG
ncbi:GerAB/ArcD/ProY family transporter [Schinkia sp. CFF1]